MSDLEDFYYRRVINDLPPHARKPFSELTKDVKQRMEDTIGFASFVLAKRCDELWDKIVGKQ